MELANIKSFKLGSSIKGFFLCYQKHLKTTRLGDPFIDVILKDNTGSIRGKVWRHVEYFSSKFEKGDVVAVKGSIIKFNNTNEVSLSFVNNVSDDFYSEYGYSSDIIIGSIDKSVKVLYTYILKTINSLPSNHKKNLIYLYDVYENKIKVSPLEKKEYYLKGGYLLFIYNLLVHFSNIIKNYNKLDADRVRLCILLTYIGYIDFFDENLVFSISDKGKILDYKILGINLLNKISSNKISEEDKLFYQQCIMMDRDTQDINIKFVRYLIELDSIAR